MTRGKGGKIALMGPFGFGNLGDAAIQDAVVQNIRRRRSDARIYGVSQNPEDTRVRHGIDAFPLNRTPGVGADWESRSRESVFGKLGGRLQRTRVGRILERLFIRMPLEVFYILRSCRNLWGFDLLVVSGGGQLDDYWGGAWSHPYTLAKWGTLARIVGARFVVLSVGAGPIDAPMSKRFICYALSLASYRSYRDERSRALIASIGFQADDPVFPDLAYSIPVAGEVKEWKEGEPLVVGVGPMSYCHPDIWPERDMTIYQGYLRTLAASILWLLGEGCTIVLFPSEIGSDRVAMNDLKAMLAEKGITEADGRISTAELRTVKELLHHLSQMDVVVASRFHGVLLAHLLRKPVLAVSYHDKIDELMKQMGHGRYCLNIRTFTQGEVQEAFMSLRAQLPAAREQIARKTQEYRHALDKQYDTVFG